MIRTIDGFHQDEQDDWVAELSCLHMQHVRHEPPSAIVPGSRRHPAGAVGSAPTSSAFPATVPRCRTGWTSSALWDPSTPRPCPVTCGASIGLPKAPVACVRLIEGTVGFSMETDPRTVVQLRAGDVQPIPPTVPPAVHVEGHFRVAIDFLVRGMPSPTARSDARLLEQDVLGERTP